jgi:DNA-binding transcriptional regulator of glucitol operon
MSAAAAPDPPGSVVTVRKLVTPRWVLLHVLAVIAFLVCLRLGWWQWDRAQSHTGTFQNLGYALQWPVFAGFVAVLWWKTIRDVLHPELREQREAARAEKDRAKAAEAAAAAAGTPGADPAQVVPAAAVLPTVEEDPEVAAYNRYLASLYARDEERARQQRARRTAGARGGT